MKIGFIGLGIMGSRMATNLIKSGFELVLYNRTKSKAQDLLQKGAEFVESPEALAKSVDIVFTMLSTPGVVQEVSDKILPNLKHDSWWVDMSTVNPSFSRALSKKALMAKVNFVDAPVAGSKAPAENGELLFLVGGKQEELQALAPYFDSMGRKSIFLDEVGNGANLKMLINLLLAQSMTAFSEAMALGKEMGLPSNQLLDILTVTPVTAPFIGGLKTRLANDNFETNFPLKWIHKDIMLALDTASELKVKMASLEQTETLYKAAIENGFGELDFSAIYKSINA
ncbi:NAD(P)-dependent oxidoreductase [Roseivirga misakiensis]|uniref:6-phosphogluconate dehydrogenase n=1 Tax=Roseivirga misakiensis TaxID=1563681 RepID=A0A1E5T6F2_9BACT|nr:NAD(P)-dependent oxidoreductase [Roseivirga misakiensis]OEK06943.1 6-phosphogluconate dehydrogenase [Roseivirga misakiensis]